MKKKIFGVIALASVALLAACGGGNGEQIRQVEIQRRKQRMQANYL